MLKTALLLLATQSAQPFSELPLPPKDAILHQIEHVGPLQVSGDELTFAVRLSSERVWVSGGLRQDMNLVEGTQDIWAARIKVPRCSESTISWYFGYIASNGQARYTGKSVYRGPKAALPPEERENFRGRIETREIESHSLGEKRRISIYLPSHSALDGEPLLTIYTTDGATRQIASLIEPQIDSKSLPPIAVVGVDNGGYRGDFNKPADSKFDFRSREYRPDVDPDRFNKHLEFFTEEVVRHVETLHPKLGGSKAKRVLIGWSHGGTFTAEAGLRKGSVFGLVVPLSISAPPVTKVRPEEMPRFYLSAGTLEPFFASNTRMLETQLSNWKADFTYSERVAGHDLEMWKGEVLKALEWYLKS